MTSRRRLSVAAAAAALSVTGVLGVTVAHANTLPVGAAAADRRPPGAPAEPSAAQPAPVRVMPLPGTVRWSTPFHQAGRLWASGFHTGQDFSAATGTPLLAVADGTVETAGPTAGGYPGGFGPYGNMVLLRLDPAPGDGGAVVQIRYAHLANVSVSAGQPVTAGQVLGASGATGNVTGPHLHFEVLVNGAFVDPRGWLTGASVADLTAGMVVAAGTPSVTLAAETAARAQTAVGDARTAREAADSALATARARSVDADRDLTAARAAAHRLDALSAAATGAVADAQAQVNRWASASYRYGGDPETLGTLAVWLTAKDPTDAARTQQYLTSVTGDRVAAVNDAAAALDQYQQDRLAAIATARTAAAAAGQARAAWDTARVTAAQAARQLQAAEGDLADAQNAYQAAQRAAAAAAAARHAAQKAAARAAAQQAGNDAEPHTSAATTRPKPTPGSPSPGKPVEAGP